MIELVAFIRTWITVVVVFFILSLAWAVFSPLMNGTFNDLVDHAIGTNANLQGNNGENLQYYYQLHSAKTLIVGFFNFFPFALGCILLTWAVLSSLRKEESDYYV